MFSLETGYILREKIGDEKSCHTTPLTILSNRNVAAVLPNSARTSSRGTSPSCSMRVSLMQDWQKFLAWLAICRSEAEWAVSSSSFSIICSWSAASTQISRFNSSAHNDPSVRVVEGQIFHGYHRYYMTKIKSMKRYQRAWHTVSSKNVTKCR